MTERECLYLMARTEEVGPRYFDRLMNAFGSARAAWAEREPSLPEKMLAGWRRMHEPETELACLREMENLPPRGIRFVTRSDREFPRRFLELADPPKALWVIGGLPAPEKPAAAVIGARKCTEYGKGMAIRLGGELASYGVSVISGMAAGIDMWAQTGAEQAGGFSAAVLGSGIDVCYPSSSARLYDSLQESGGILSEYGPGTPGLPFHFPVRNRLIAALADVVIVLEARLRSGTMITVDQALEQGRDVMALPGRVGDPLSRGCNELIRQGAYILTGISDVLQVLGMEEAEKAEGEEQETEVGIASLPAEARRVLDAVGTEPVHRDEIARRSGIALSRLFEILWKLELAGWIRTSPGDCYIRK